MLRSNPLVTYAALTWQVVLMIQKSSTRFFLFNLANKIAIAITLLNPSSGDKQYVFIVQMENVILT
jgi:hypothetical protein